MFSHLGAVIAASATLVLLSTVHSLSTEVTHPQASIILLPGSARPHGMAPHDQAISGATVSAIAIGY
jgi:hypothetical protein